jgi:hypothetical protein
MPPPIYTQLRAERHETRVAKILPSRRQCTPIRCTLEVVSLQDNPEFEALSWSWGDLHSTISITLQNQPWQVPVNLRRALRQLRFQDKPRVVWIDALSINQADLQERAAQVAMMGQIYKSAALVRVWLGTMLSKDQSDVFSCFEKLSQGVDIRRIYHEYTADRVSTTKQIGHFEIFTESAENMYSGTDHPFLDTLSSFFKLEWWSRLWVIQEVVVAPIVFFQWGSRSLDLTQLLRARDLLEADLRQNLHLTAVGFGLTPLSSFVSLFKLHLDLIEHFRGLHLHLERTDWSSKIADLFSILIEILARCRYRSATDARDKIYGLLGLFPLELVQAIRPSYLKSADDVYCQVAYQLLQSTRSFMLFSCVGERVPGCPSWVPIWDFEYHHYEDLHVRLNQQRLFSACNKVELQLDRVSDGVIRLKGILLDTITAYQAPPLEAIDAASLWDLLHMWSLTLLRAHQRSNRYPIHGSRVGTRLWCLEYPSGIPLGEAFWRTMINDCTPVADHGIMRRASVQDWTKAEDWFMRMRVPDIYSPEMANYSEGLSFGDGGNVKLCDFVRSITQGRNFLLTGIGYIGFSSGMDYVRRGDEIWIIAGGSHPIVLRPANVEERTYEAVSEAYVQGVMDGEAVRGECPVFREDNDGEAMRKQCLDGRASWHAPEWVDIQII